MFKTKLKTGSKYIYTTNAVEQMKKWDMKETTVKKVINESNRKEVSPDGVTTVYSRFYTRHEKCVLAAIDAKTKKTFIISVWEIPRYKK